MNHKSPQQLLSDPNQKPTDKLFKSILDDKVYNILKKIDQTILEAGLLLEWRYYNDGKAWLGKVTYKNKTVVWLSVWKEFIKAGFYFTEKARPSVLELDFSTTLRS